MVAGIERSRARAAGVAFDGQAEEDQDLGEADAGGGAVGSSAAGGKRSPASEGGAGLAGGAGAAEPGGGGGGGVAAGARETTVYAKNLVSLANALVEVDRETYAAHAEAIIRRAAQVLSRTLGPMHLDVADLALLPLAHILGQVRGSWLDAAQTLLRARTIMLTWLPPEHERVGDVSQLLAQAQAQVEVASSLPQHRGPAPVNAASLY